MSKRRKIYDNDGTTVTETETVSDNAELIRADSDAPVMLTGKRIKVQDVLCAVGSYMSSSICFFADPKDGEGKCMACGKRTAWKIRKLCPKCMTKQGKSLFDAAVRALENGDQEFDAP